MHLSVWEKESFYAPADVIIAGSGLVGLWCAHYLKKKQPDLRITIVDRGIIPTGASTRNAGFACFGSVTELMSDIALMGERATLDLAARRFAGLSRILKTFPKKSIDFEYSGGYELIAPVGPGRLDELKAQVHWLNREMADTTDRKNTYAFADGQLRKFGFRGIGHLIANRLEGALHSGKLCQQLLRKVQARGVTLLNNIEITHFQRGAGGVELFTDKHINLRAGKLLVCTNAFARQLLPDLDVIPARGQVLVTAPIPGLRFQGTFHFDEGYYYFRNLGERLLLGGARNTAPEQETSVHLDITDNIQQRLEEFMRDHLLPGTPFEVSDRWSGIMGMGPEKLPIVKKIADNLYCALRMSGMGVALAPEVGHQVAGMMV